MRPHLPNPAWWIAPWASNESQGIAPPAPLLCNGRVTLGPGNIGLLTCLKLVSLALTLLTMLSPLRAQEYTSPHGNRVRITNDFCHISLPSGEPWSVRLPPKTGTVFQAGVSSDGACVALGRRRIGADLADHEIQIFWRSGLEVTVPMSALNGAFPQTEHRATLSSLRHNFGDTGFRYLFQFGERDHILLVWQSRSGLWAAFNAADGTRMDGLAPNEVQITKAREHLAKYALESLQLHLALTASPGWLAEDYGFLAMEKLLCYIVFTHFLSEKDYATLHALLAAEEDMSLFQAPHDVSVENPNRRAILKVKDAIVNKRPSRSVYDFESLKDVPTDAKLIIEWDRPIRLSTSQIYVRLVSSLIPELGMPLCVIVRIPNGTLTQQDELRTPRKTLTLLLGDLPPGNYSVIVAQQDTVSDKITNPFAFSTPQPFLVRSNYSTLVRVKDILPLVGAKRPGWKSWLGLE